MRVGNNFVESHHPLLHAARAEALALGHHYIGTEHLLLALSQSDDDEVRASLDELGLSSEAVRAAAVKMVGRGENSVDPMPADHAYTFYLQDVLRDADADLSEGTAVTPRHFLQAILAQSEMNSPRRSSFRSCWISWG